MLSKDSSQPLPSASPLGDAEAGSAQVLDPRTPIEVASGGNGTINDPAGSDTKPPSPPPGFEDLELFV